MSASDFHFTGPDERPDDASENSTPVFATSVCDFAGIPFPKGARK